MIDVQILAAVRARAEQCGYNRQFINVFVRGYEAAGRSEERVAPYDGKKSPQYKKCWERGFDLYGQTLHLPELL